ncbi:class I SAM-dependent methyltransferase [Rhizomonospora bruguierae]|uniref:class I SAM-dependent methyltransferase n=1 Tax=Rhizomonospora bruguierae TaxID=1581705 RepID=UPI001BD0875A|nr:methyltransferase [Micromonospora sp. NBRC 107566]
MTGEHYFTAVPGAPERRREIGFSIDGREYRLAAAAGVFSGDRLDPGTAVLLRKVAQPAPDEAGTLLDLGCGYGPIAVVLADRAPSATVYAVDVNTRALELVRENAAGRRVRAARPDEVPEEVTFSQIWSNPPIRVGKADLHDLLGRWLPRLAPGGVAWLVVARHLGGDSLQRWLTDAGWSVARHASQKGYRILRVGRESG